MSVTAGTYNGYPVEFDGQWMKVVRHYSGSGEFFSSANDWAEAKWSNPENPSANKYSILEYVKNFKFDGKYTFKLSYPQYPDRNNIWSQAQNPLDIMEVLDGFVQIETGWGGNYWGGLTRSNQTGTTFLDGSNPHGNWYFAVCSASSWGGSTNFPGPGIAVNTVELWVKATGDDMKAIYNRQGAAVPSNVEIKAGLGEWNGYGSEPVSRASMVGLPVGAGRDLQVWGLDAENPRFWSAGQNPGELKHIADQLSGTKFATTKEAIDWLNSKSDQYHLHNEDLYPKLEGLIAHWDFANPDSYTSGSSVLYDISGQGNHMTYYGDGPHPIEERDRVKGYYFRNYDGFTTGTWLANVNRSCTIEAYIYADAAETTSGDRGCIFRAGIYMSWNKGNQQMSNYWYSTDNQGYHEPGVAMNRNQWYHLVSVWDSSTNRLYQYMDGALVNTVTTTVNGSPSITGGQIGQEGTSRQFSGAISTVKIYNLALSATDIERNYEYYSKLRR